MNNFKEQKLTISCTVAVTNERDINHLMTILKDDVEATLNSYNIPSARLKLELESLTK
jgi:hypothetical protein